MFDRCPFILCYALLEKQCSSASPPIFGALESFWILHCSTASHLIWRSDPPPAPKVIASLFVIQESTKTATRLEDSCVQMCHCLSALRPGFEHQTRANIQRQPNSSCIYFTARVGWLAHSEGL